MKKIVTLLAIAALALALSCEDSRDPEPAAPQVQATAEDLVDLLPSSTLAAVKLLGLADRWDEVRALPPLARLQDRMLDHLGLAADDVPDIAGSQAVLALVTDDAARRLVLLAVLDPPSPARALQRLAESDALVAREARGALWIGSVNHASLIERIAAGDGTSLRQTVDFSQLGERLPAGGLVRAIINTPALSEALRRWAEFQSARPAAALARLVAADLEAVEVAGLRRDIVDGELVTDMWVGIDQAVVPEEFTRALSAERGPAALPRDLPANVMIAKAFRTEPETGLAWLRTLAANDPGGPLRNLEFWIDEFEARSGRNVETDIVDALGARGLLLLIEGDDDGALEMVAVLDARDPDRLEAALIDLRDWLADQIRGRSLGLALPKVKNADHARGAAHGLDFWSPFGSFSGPVFQLVADRLVFATSQRSLDLGARLARDAATWTPPDWALGDGPPDEVAWIRAGALARIFDAASIRAWSEAPDFGAIGEFLAGVGEGRVSVYYEEQGLRISAQIDLGAAGTPAARGPNR
jgi:hypothetical protein